MNDKIFLRQFNDRKRSVSECGQSSLFLLHLFPLLLCVQIVGVRNMQPLLESPLPSSIQRECRCGPQGATGVALCCLLSNYYYNYGNQSLFWDSFFFQRHFHVHFNPLLLRSVVLFV